MIRMLSSAYSLFVLLAVLIVFALSSMVFLSMGTATENDCRKITYTGPNKLGCYLNIEYAKSRQERKLGLSGRDYMPADSGMLFVFDKTKRQCIWMKDMKFNLDIIWFNENKQVVKKLDNISPKTHPKSFCADNAKYVLELNSGVADKLDLGVGDSIKL